ncbi:sulfotransferase [Sphingomonas sp. NSE70-1]|uniref:Sulfotransferase n=1 Tax=Sphingomonas caseinilyticus TaxID=2908205 RepID=A0ABT0RSC1_9SPHN|nr:sulfotransferase [Sphingomonas caseinilyticus]MCL6697907.1 sulfotransferase [Sphingomonas caseinilyticus]
MSREAQQMAKTNPLVEGYQSLEDDPGKSGKLAREALRLHPESPPALRLVGLAMRASGQTEEAAEFEQRAVKAATSDPVLLRAGHALFANQLHEAEPLLKERLKRDPYDYSAMRMLAELAARIGRIHDSESLLRRTVELAPSFQAARANLATVLYRQHRAPEALEQLDQLGTDGEIADSYRNLRAAALGRIGGYEEAIDLYRDVLRRHPEQPKIWMSMAHLLKTVGNQEESISAYRRAIELAPSLGEVWWSLANLKTITFDDEDVRAMEAALDDAALDIDDRLHLHFALGKAYEDRRSPEQSWRHYEAGNDIQSKRLGHNPNRITRIVDRSIPLMTRDFFAARNEMGCEAPDPIFILGMPRAGSTLVEQILASHSRVEGTMELPDISALVRQIDNKNAGEEFGNYPDALANLDGDTLAALGQEYLDRTRIQRSEGKPFFIDKMPNNWVHAGFIRLILPNAKIIDARRHPLDCGFSNFKQHYARGQAFSYDLAHIGRYYADYVRFMDHIDRAQPGAVHRVIHERLVENPEQEIRALLAYCGLEWEDSCLRFHETKRAVRTASSEQVRQPLSKAGLGQWQPYEQWLAPLKTALGPALQHWDDAPLP